MFMVNKLTYLHYSDNPLLTKIKIRYTMAKQNVVLCHPIGVFVNRSQKYSIN